MHEATFRIEPGGPYGAATAGTGASVELWCNEGCDLLDVRGDPEGRVLSAVEERVGVRDHLVDGGRAVIVTASCLRDRRRTVERHLARHSCLLVPPLRYASGAKFCRVLALAPADLTATYRDLLEEGRVTVESKREVSAPAAGRPLASLSDALPSLSDRQRETLLLAHERGYYEIPRGTTTAALADELGIARRTAEDHLRRAEGKLVDALADHLRARPWPASGG